MPSALRDALAVAASSSEGLFVYGVPYRDPIEKRPVRFDASAAFDVISTHGESLPQTERFVPFAYAGRTPDDEAFAIDPSDPQWPVYFFEHEVGFHAFAPSLAAFCAALLQKGVKTPLEKLQKAVEKAESLDERQKYREVIAQLEPALVGVPRTSREDTVSTALNFLGTAYRETGSIDRAIATFEEAAKLGEDNATLNLCALFEDIHGDFARSLAAADVLMAEGHRLSDYAWFWSRNYVGRAALVLGDVSRAVEVFHAIHARFLSEDPSKLREAAEGLEKLGKDRPEVASSTALIVKWLGAAPPLAPGELEAARAWFSGLPKALKTHLAASIEHEEPMDDRGLVRLLTAESIRITEAGLKELSFLAPLRRLERLTVDGNRFADLTTLPELPRLQSLSMDECKALVSTKGIERAPQLTDLSAGECKLQSLEGLSQLRRLESVNLHGNKIADLSAFSGLEHLETLTIYQNQLTDLTPLAHCPRLQRLECFDNDKIKKGLSALTTLPRLEEIAAVSWKISDEEMDAFQKARPEVELDVEGREKRRTRKTTDAHRAWWASLSDHPQLKEALRKELDAEDSIDEQIGKIVTGSHLSIESSGITSVKPLAVVAELSFLDVSLNPLESFQGLEALRDLQQVRARRTKVRDLLAFTGNGSLFELNVSETPLQSLEGLERCVALRDLSCSRTSVKSLAPLAALSEIRELRFAHTQVDDLTPISKRAHLTAVDCSATRVKSLVPLASCSSLRTVECYGLEGVTGLKALAPLKDLRSVFSRGALKPDENEQFRALRPDVFVD